MATLIVETVDFQESMTRGAFTVKPFVDSRLDDLRKCYDDLPEFLATVRNETQDCPVEQFNVVYFPQLGFLVTVTADAAPQVTFDLQFLTENVAYFKNDRMRQLDSEIGDIHTDIMDIAVEIEHQLCAEIIVKADRWTRYCDLCSELDWYDVVIVFLICPL
jgi:DNA mismatch repair protein MSH5